MPDHPVGAVVVKSAAKLSHGGNVREAQGASAGVAGAYLPGKAVAKSGGGELDKLFAKSGGGGVYAYLPVGKLACVQKHAVKLCKGAAGLGRPDLAELVFYFGRKRQIHRARQRYS